jgi:hypothetical protein
MAKPSDYERRSEAFGADSFAPQVRAELDAFAESVGAEIDLRAVRAAVRTDGIPRGKGGFLRKAPVPVAQHALITDRHLIIVTLRDGEQINMIYRLDAIDVADFKPTLIEDVGLEITGAMIGGYDRATAFLGLDRGQAGSAFRAKLLEAARPEPR